MPANRYQTADELLQAIESLRRLLEHRRHSPRRDRPASGGELFVSVGGARHRDGRRAPCRVRRDRWVHQTALPELNRLIVAAENDSAFDLAMQIQEAAPRDTALEALWPRFARWAVVRSIPEGATVYRASATDTSRWFLVGTTPTDSVRLPTGVSLYRFEKPGYRTAYSLFPSNEALIDIGYLPPMQLTLDSLDAPFSEMIWIPGDHPRVHGRFRWRHTADSR